jgi:rhodanese-related sulfurtransferase
MIAQPRRDEGCERDDVDPFEQSGLSGLISAPTWPSNGRRQARPIMPQTITRGYKTLLEEANAKVETIPASDAIQLLNSGDVVFVDLRDPRELEREGRMPGAFHCPRGMLEFWIDPDSPYHKKVFAQDKQFVFFCAGGWRSALSAATAKDMGLKPVAHLGGGFAAWKEAGGPVELESSPKEKA